MPSGRPLLETIGVFAACSAFISAYSLISPLRFDPLLIGSISLVCAAYYFLKQKQVRAEAIAKRDEWQRALSAAREHAIAKAKDDMAFSQACGQAAEAMSYLGEGTFSLFVSVHQQAETAQENPGFVALVDTPLYYVLQHLERLDCVRLSDQFPALDEPAPAPLAWYQLTDLGKGLLPLFLKDAAKRRAVRSAIAEQMADRS